MSSKCGSIKTDNPIAEPPPLRYLGVIFGFNFFDFNSLKIFFVINFN